MTDEVADQVLRNNYLQSQAISLLEQRSVADLGDHQQLLRLLEREGELNRALEFLPSDSDIEERMVRGRGLTRPELAVLLAYGKIALNHALTEADIAGGPVPGRRTRALFSAALAAALRLTHRAAPAAQRTDRDGDHEQHPQPHGSRIRHAHGFADRRNDGGGGARVHDRARQCRPARIVDGHRSAR